VKKVGILTIYDNTNYGNRLQNYATHKVLQEIGVNSETIINETKYNKNNFLKKIKKYNYNLKAITEKILYRIKKIIYKKYIDKRKKSFLQFNNDNLNFYHTTINKDFIPSELSGEFDNFIVGSDQVWNPNAERISEIDFMLFAPKEKNISFAASFGVSEISKENIKLYKEGLNNINSISVREDRGKELVKEICNKDAVVLIDPTMLLDKEEWKKVSRQLEKKLPERYILTYFLGKVSNRRKEYVKETAKKHNLEVVELNSIKDIDYYSIGPSEFIYCIDNATMIFTDSFHGCVFSVLFDKNFYIFKREGANKSMNSRIDTFLSKFKLENRAIEESETVSLEHDYSHCKKTLDIERKKSINFLKAALDM